MITILFVFPLPMLLAHLSIGDDISVLHVQQVDEAMKVVKVEMFYDRGELIAGLMKGLPSSSGNSVGEAPLSCPLLRNTG